MKPNSTLFGEKLPEHAIYKAHSLTEDADAFLVAGSSLTVEPAASLPEKAMEYGAELIIVNHDQTRVSHMTKLDYRADVTDVLPELRDRLV